LQLTHLWVFTSTAEEARRLDAEVANLLLMAVNDAEAVLLHDLLVLLLQLLLLLFTHGFPLLRLLLVVGVNLAEVAKLQVGDQLLLLLIERLLPVMEEVFIE